MSSKHQHVPVTPQLQAASPAMAAATPESCKAAPFMGWDGDEGGGRFPCRLSREEFLCKYAQLCPTLCDPMDYSPTRLLCPPNPPSKNPGVGCHSLLQGIFPNQGLNPRLLHCRQILYHLSHQGSPSTNY